MHDAMALSCCWRSENCDAASVLVDHANDAWEGAPCLRHYYYYDPGAWRAKGGGYDGIDCHYDSDWSHLTYGVVDDVPQPVHCDGCRGYQNGRMRVDHCSRSQPSPFCGRAHV